MTKASRILLIALLGLAAGIGLGATGLPLVAAPQVVVGEGSGSGSGFGYGFGGGSYLGVDTQDVTKERMADLKLKEERGVEVLMVDQDAPAGKAGVKEHDVILEFNGAKVESVEQLRRMIHEVPPGRTVTLGISRGGQPLTLNATLAERNKQQEFNYVMPKIKAPKVVIPKVEMPDMREFQFVLAGSGRAGLLVENLTPQLGEYFGVKNGEGVLVRSVEKGSPAEAAGFKAGDIIVRVEQDKVADRSDWRSTMRSHRSGKVSVGIIRDRKEQTLSLVLPETKEQSSVWHIEAPDMEELDNDLEEMDIEINRLGPGLERMHHALTERLSASLTQNRDELRKATALVRDQQRAARQAQLDATRAAQKARLEAEHALLQQRKELDKARQMMLRKMEMD
ncbi:MAG: PDZ domain-containing protein [Terriglobales bacterium]